MYKWDLTVRTWLLSTLLKINTNLTLILHGRPGRSPRSCFRLQIYPTLRMTTFDDKGSFLSRRKTKFFRHLSFGIATGVRDVGAKKFCTTNLACNPGRHETISPRYYCVIIRMRWGPKIKCWKKSVAHSNNASNNSQLLHNKPVQCGYQGSINSILHRVRKFSSGWVHS